MKFYCFRILPGAKGKFVSKGSPIGFEMAEKNVNKQTDRQTNIFEFILVEIDTVKTKQNRLLKFTVNIMITSS